MKIEPRCRQEAYYGREPQLMHGSEEGKREPRALQEARREREPGARHEASDTRESSLKHEAKSKREPSSQHEATSKREPYDEQPKRNQCASRQ
jgi:hypothetical protein